VPNPTLTGLVDPYPEATAKVLPEGAAPTGEQLAAAAEKHLPQRTHQLFRRCDLCLNSYTAWCLGQTVAETSPFGCRCLNSPPCTPPLLDSTLFDEVEAHLHPQRQRILLPALLRAVKSRLLCGTDTPVQIIATTHAPLALASVEPHFAEKPDRLFSFELRDGGVRLQPVKWAPQGDALNWLVSETFGLKQARSVEGERAVEAVQAWMRGDHAALPRFLERNLD